MFPLLPFFMCDPLYIAFGVHRLWWLRFVTFFFPLATEEKKSLKRTFQQIQEEEDDDYPGSYSPQDPSAGPLLVCLDPQGRAADRVVWSDLWLQIMATRWRRWPVVWNRWRVALWALGVQDPSSEACQTVGLTFVFACQDSGMDLCFIVYVDLALFHS